MSQSKLLLGIGGMIVAGALIAFLAQHQAQNKLSAENEFLRQQMAQLQAANGSLSNALATVGNSKRLPPDQLNELLKLRGEIGMLQQQVGDVAKLREEVQRLQTAPRVLQTSPAGIDALAQERQAAILNLNRAKQGLLAFIMYADENQQQFPTSFNQAAPFLKDGLEPIEMNFEIVYIGSLTNITNPAVTVVLREKHASQTLDGKWRKTYGFADGHAEIHSEPTSNFDDWESQHIIPPSNQ